MNILNIQNIKYIKYREIYKSIMFNGKNKCNSLSNGVNYKGTNIMMHHNTAALHTKGSKTRIINKYTNK